MSVLVDPGFGLEEVATGALYLLMDGLNEELEEIEAFKAPADEALADRRGVEYVPVTLEQVEDENFHLGHVPSLIEDSTPLDSYPALSVMAYRAGPAGTDAGDHYAEYKDSMYVELLVKASPSEGEEVCDKRAWRTADAVHNVIMRDRTLMGAVYEVGDSPTCLVSEVFVRPSNPSEGHGEDWFWQAARIEYGVNKYSPFAG